MSITTMAGFHVRNEKIKKLEAENKKLKADNKKLKVLNRKWKSRIKVLENRE